MSAYTNLTAPKNTTSGIGDFVLVAHENDFEVDGIKCPTPPFANPGDSTRILEPHVFKAGRGFAKMTCAPEKNKLDAKTIGDTGFNKLDFVLDVFFAGSYAEIHEQVKDMLNQPLIVLARDSECAEKVWYQLGCDCTRAYLSVDFSTGTTKDGIKGYNGKFTWQNSYVQTYAHEDGPEVLVAA